MLCVFTVGHTDIRIEKSRGSSSLSRLKDSESALFLGHATEWAQLMSLVRLEMSEAVTREW